MKKYDIIIIGAGPAAINFSRAAQGSDKKILAIEEDKFGGTCPNYGCEPKIFLEGAVRNVLSSQLMQNRGIGQASTIDWQALMKTKKATWENMPAAQEMGFKNLGIDTLHGYAKFVDNYNVEVNGE